MSRLSACAAASVVGVLALTLASCGGPHIPVQLPETGASLEGVVKYGNEDIQFAMIMAQSPSGTAFGAIGDDGRYHLASVPLGEVTLAVNTSAARGDYQTAVMRGGAYTGPDGKGRKRVSLKFIDVPQKFFDPNASGIKTTVEKGTNTYDIVIPR